MTKHLTGATYDAFAAALERVVIDFIETLQLASREPVNAAEWRETYVELADAWFRMGGNLADMVKTATGEDVSHFFARHSRG